MADTMQVIQAGQGWYVETPTGRVGPMESREEANAYLSLMRIADAAGTELGCTDAECHTC